MKRTLFKNELLGEYTLAQHPSGLQIYIMEKKNFATSYALFGTKYGSVDTRFSKNGEPYREVPAGIAHFLEHKLFESEEGDAFTRFADTGAYCNAFTSFDKTCYLFSCSKNFEKNLDILLDFVQSPYFTPETVKKEQGIIAQEIKMYDDSPGWRVMFNMLGAMYQEHPVKIDIAGTVDSIAQIDDKLLYDCYNTFYNPANMFVCVAGNVDTDAVISQIESGLKATEPVAVQRASFNELDAVNERFVSQELETSKPLFCLGFKELLCEKRAGIKQRITAGLSLEILCGDCSELYRRLVDNGLIGEEFSAEYFQGEGYAAYIIEGETDNPEAVADEIYAEIERLIANGISKELFNAARKSAYGDAVKRFDSAESIAMDLLDCAVAGGSLFDSVEELKTVTEEDIILCLKKLRREISVLSVINPKSK